MAAHHQQDIPALPSAVWAADPVSLKDFVMKKELPNVVKVVKGHFMNIGVPKFPLQRMHQEVFLHSVRTSVKVFCHCVRIRTESKSGRFPYTLVSLEQRLSIPISYHGWFEVLSEDGKGAKPIESVQELARRFPEKCLVRQPMKAYLANGDGRIDQGKSRTVNIGELLKLSGDVSVPVSQGSKDKTKLLRCIDSKGESVYLSFEQKGLFTPISSGDGITGVHSIRDIVSKFRLPLTVKLIQGVWPKVDKSRFTGVIRLDWVYTDETAFVCPIVKEHLRMLPVPADCPLKLIPATNMDEVKESEAYKQIMHKCTRMLSNYNNTIHLIMAMPEMVIKSRRSARAVQEVLYKSDKPGTNKSPSAPPRRSKSKEAILMDEIDDLYQYVRDGGSPPKSKFTYDSDEESFWEEPAYESLDDFRTRLAALEKGLSVNYPRQYQPTDAIALKLPKDAEFHQALPKPLPKPPSPPPRMQLIPDPKSNGTVKSKRPLFSRHMSSPLLTSANTTPTNNDITHPSTAIVAIVDRGTQQVELNKSQSTPQQQPQTQHGPQSPTAPLLPEEPPRVNGESGVFTIEGVPQNSSSTDPPPLVSSIDQPKRGLSAKSASKLGFKNFLLKRRSTDARTMKTSQQNITKMGLPRSKSGDAILVSSDSNFGSSMAGARIGRDWKDFTDRSTKTRSSDSSGQRDVRRKVQTLYL